MKIRMLENVRPDFPCCITAAPGTILRRDMTYEATSNKLGAICGVCENGESLGVKPGEFVFTEVPQWVYDIWANECPYSVEHATIEQEEQNA